MDALAGYGLNKREDYLARFDKAKAQQETGERCIFEAYPRQYIRGLLYIIPVISQFLVFQVIK